LPGRGSALLVPRSVTSSPGSADHPLVARVLQALGAVVLFGGACFAFLAAGTWKWLACENEGTEACGRADLAFAQFVLAIVGFVPALTLVIAAVLGKRWLVVAALAVGLPLYAVWAVMLDAAIHGWDDLKLVP
jgi:hypothetical protein